MTTWTSESLLTCGLDVGARSVKVAILSHEGTVSVVLAQAVVRIQGRCGEHADRTALREGWGRVLADASLSAAEIDYVASTGTRDRQTVRIGRFYERSRALDAGFVRSLRGHLLASGSNVSLLTSPEAIFAGAYGAAILAARRYRRISRALDPTAADTLAQRILGMDRQMLN
jgi:activator of 2-hydroxyglutaryl-CoA dehydratase